MVMVMWRRRRKVDFLMGIGDTKLPGWQGEGAYWRYDLLCVYNN